MCGIGGVISAGARLDDVQTQLQQLSSALAHRGPDSFGSVDVTLSGLNVHALHHRLAIQDLSDAGHQPMRGRHGSLLVYNGEIYNCEYLASRLPEHQGRQGHSDSEVLLATLDEYGIDSLCEVEGMFAFLYVPPHGREAFLVRDRLGIKPLYWAKDRNGFWFASEARAIGRALQRGIDHAAVAEWMQYQLPVTERTFFEGVQAVEPGGVLRINSDGVTSSRYWTPTKFTRNEEVLHVASPTQLRDCLEAAVAEQMVGDVPIAATLSGGMDSSSVVALAAKHGLAAAFTGDYGAPGYSEIEYADAVARHVNVPLEIVHINAAEYFSALPNVATALDFPVAGPGSVGQYLVAERVARDFKVVLSGLGGDELLLGYTRDRLPLLSAALLSAAHGSLDSTEWHAIAGNLQGLRGYSVMYEQFAKAGGFLSPLVGFMNVIDRRADWATLFDIDTDLLQQSHDSLMRKLNVRGSQTLHAVHQGILTFETEVFLQSLLQVEDRVSMWHGVESRVPLLATRTVELLLPLSITNRMAGTRPKDLLRSAMQDALPPAVLARTDKMGFPVPFRQWATDRASRARIDALLDSITDNRRPFVNTDTLTSVRAGAGLPDRVLWALLLLESFFQANWGS